MTTQNKFLKMYDLLYRRFGPQHWWPGDTPLEIVAGAILTQNTAWTNVEKAIGNLKKEGLLVLKKLFDVPPVKLARLIRPAGYFNIKAKRLKNFIIWVSRRYGSLEEMFQTPMNELRRELLEVNGIGPETADSILLYGGRKPVFVVDAYTRRVLSRHGLSREDAAYEELRSLFVKNLPRKVSFYNEYHALIVKVGKELCRKKKPLCTQCPLNGFNWIHGPTIDKT